MIVCNMNHYIYIYTIRNIYIHDVKIIYICIYTHGVHPFGKTNSKPAGYTIKPLIMHTCTTAYSYHNKKSHAYIIQCQPGINKPTLQWDDSSQLDGNKTCSNSPNSSNSHLLTIESLSSLIHCHLQRVQQRLKAEIILNN